MDINQYFPSTSSSLRASDLNGKAIKLVIAGVEAGPAALDGKPIVSFANSERTLVLNKTNAKQIAKIHGSNTNDWNGKEVTLYPTTTEYNGQEVACIRVRDQIEEYTPGADEDPFA